MLGSGKNVTRRIGIMRLSASRKESAAFKIYPPIEVTDPTPFSFGLLFKELFMLLHLRMLESATTRSIVS